MIVKPQRAERFVQPGLLVGENRVWLADRSLRPLDRLGGDVRVFAPWEIVDRYARAGQGELVCWGEDPIRWRQSKHGDSHRRSNDVVIVKLDEPGGPSAWLDGLQRWAEWLRRHDASVGWSLGGTSMRLLKATLAEPLVTTNGALPPARWTLGGRQQCWLEPGSIVEGAVELDMQAAYTRVIGGLAYGGVWRKLTSPSLALCERFGRHGLPMLARARVQLPDGLQVGPLPKRPRSAPDRRVEQLAATVPYPVEGALQGLWSWPELLNALEAGGRVRLLELYVHCVHRGARPFAAWLDAVEEGRGMPGFAGRLAKATGNALWGQFVIDDRNGLHVLRWNGQARRFPVWASRGHQKRAWDLGELVCGQVRAELYRGLLAPAGSSMVCCHTDGGWIRGDVPIGERSAPSASPTDPGPDGAASPPGWRTKGMAARLELLDQQHYRVTDAHGRRRLVMAGVPAYRAGEVFEALWGRYHRGEEKVA